MTGKVTLPDLKRAFAVAWAADTSADGANWSPTNPSYGQCAVTACIVQDYLGGDIVWAGVPQNGQDQPVSHYFNVVGGREVDLTRAQFADGTVVPSGIEKKKDFASTRDYVLSFPVTRERYDVLSARVAKALGRGG